MATLLLKPTLLKRKVLSTAFLFAFLVHPTISYAATDYSLDNWNGFGLYGLWFDGDDHIFNFNSSNSSDLKIYFLNYWNENGVCTTSPYASAWTVHFRQKHNINIENANHFIFYTMYLWERRSDHAFYITQGSELTFNATNTQLILASARFSEFYVVGSSGFTLNLSSLLIDYYNSDWTSTEQINFYLGGASSGNINAGRVDLTSKGINFALDHSSNLLINKNNPVGIINAYGGNHVLYTDDNDNSQNVFEAYAESIFFESDLRATVQLYAKSKMVLNAQDSLTLKSNQGAAILASKDSDTTLYSGGSIYLAGATSPVYLIQSADATVRGKSIIIQTEEGAGIKLERNSFLTIEAQNSEEVGGVNYLF